MLPRVDAGAVDEYARYDAAKSPLFAG